MSNVVALGRIAATNEPNEAIIKELEDLLEQARAGEIHALAYALVDGGGFTTTGWQNGSVAAAILVGAVSLLQYSVCNSWDNAPKVSRTPPPAS